MAVEPSLTNTRKTASGWPARAGTVRRFGSVRRAGARRACGMRIMYAVPLIAALALPNWPAGGPARADDPPAINQYEFIGRPQGFYKLVVDRDPKVCGPFAESLDEPYFPEEHNITTNLDLIGEILMNSGLRIEWTTRTIVDDHISMHRSVIESAFVDIDNDGKDDIVYRQIGWLGGHPLHRIYVNAITNDTPDVNEAITYKMMTQITRRMNDGPFDVAPGAITRNTAPDVWRVAREYYGQEAFRFGGGFYIDAISVDSRHFVIATDFAYVGRPPIMLFVMDYRNPYRYELICAFQATYHVVH